MVATALVLAGLAVLATVLVVLRRQQTTAGTDRGRPAAAGSGASRGVSGEPTGAAIPVDARLAELDRLREQAYREHRPELLDEVYADSGLAAQDAAALDRLVPAGCGLAGVHTTFTDLTSTSDAAGDIVVTTRATLAASTLSCPSRAASSVAGDGPATLRIVLVPRGSGYLIMKQQRQG